MSIALVTDCDFPVPPVRVQLRRVKRSSARTRHGINFTTRYFLELLVSPPGLLVVPDVQRDVDVIVVVINALDSLPKISSAYPATLELPMCVRLHNPVIDDLKCLA